MMSSISFENIFSYLDLKNSYKTVENAIKLCQALTVLEIIHPMIGFTKGDWSSPLIQVNHHLSRYSLSISFVVHCSKFLFIHCD